jgi:acylphosphatase
MSQKIAKKFIVKGSVQGVGFRYFTLNIANKIGINGYVENLYNGDVEVYAIGAKEQLEELKHNLLKGPAFGRVDDIVESDAQADDNITSFQINY